MSLEHPALNNFSPTWEGIKHVAGKALKWAAWGAVALGAAVLFPSALLGAGGLLLKAVGINAVSGAATSLLVGGLVKGATIGAALGAVSGVAGIGKAIDERKQDVIADYEQAMLARERAVLLARGRGQSFANSEVAVGNVAYRGRGQNQGMGIG